MKLLRPSTLLLTILMLAACGSRTATDVQEHPSSPNQESPASNRVETSLVGYWASIQGGQRGSWEFTDSGTVRIGDGPWMNYEVTDRNSVFISMDDSKGQETFFNLEGDELAIYFDAERQNLLSQFTRGK